MHAQRQLGGVERAKAEGFVGVGRIGPLRYACTENCHVHGDTLS